MSEGISKVVEFCVTVRISVDSLLVARDTVSKSHLLQFFMYKFQHFAFQVLQQHTDSVDGSIMWFRCECCALSSCRRILKISYYLKALCPILNFDWIFTCWTHLVGVFTEFA